MMLINQNRFAAKVATISAFGYFATVSTATFIDARLTSHGAYGARNYEYGYASALLSIAVFFLTLFLIGKSATLTKKILAAALPLILFFIPTLWIFRPEVPHAGIVIWIATYLIIAIVTTWLHFVGPNLAFADDQSVAYAIRAENLKSLVAVWRYFMLAVVVVMTAGFTLWPFVIFSPGHWRKIEKLSYFRLPLGAGSGNTNPTRMKKIFHPQECVTCTTP